MSCSFAVTHFELALEIDGAGSTAAVSMLGRPHHPHGTFCPCAAQYPICTPDCQHEDRKSNRVRRSICSWEPTDNRGLVAVEVDGVIWFSATDSLSRRCPIARLCCPFVPCCEARRIWLSNSRSGPTLDRAIACRPSRGAERIDALAIGSTASRCEMRRAMTRRNRRAVPTGSADLPVDAFMPAPAPVVSNARP